MKRSAARSSSSVVTPGRIFERSILRQRAWIAPAVAMSSICSGVFRMIPPRYTPSELLFHLQRREQRPDAVGDLLGVEPAVDALEQATALVVGDQRLGLGVVLVEPVADHLRPVVLTHLE